MAPKPRPWFRFYTETIHDRKIRRMKVEYRWLWVTVLALARQSPRPGILLVTEDDPYTAEDIADAAALPVRTVKNGLKVLVDAGLLGRNSDLSPPLLDPKSDALCVTNWDKRQYEGDNSTERSRRSRAKSAEGCNDDATLHERSMQRPRSVQKTETENREQRTEPDYILSNNKPVATPGVAAAEDQIVETARLVGVTLSAGALNPRAYAATVARKVMSDPDDLDRIKRELASDRSPQQIADRWRAESAPVLPVPALRKPCKACVNGMSFDEETGMAHRCQECNDLPKLEVVQ